MIGRISSFQSLGTVDGPGVRSVIFMQGCPLRCACCHNPETWKIDGGNEVEASVLIKKILRFKNYYGKTGGITVSGGEPLLQSEFVAELFKRLRDLNINTVLDTSGCIYNNSVDLLLDYTDLVLLDYKFANSDDYKKYTGGDIKSVNNFLNVLQSKQIPVWIRRVIIPGINDGFADLLQLKQLEEHYSVIEKIELLPFKKLCIEKYDSLGIEFPLRNTPEATQELIDNLMTKLQKP